MNVLVVCFGNIYRSPLCAAFLRKFFDGYPNCAVTISSAGFYEEERKAARAAREYAAQHSVSLNSHRSTKCTEDMVEKADVIIYFDRSNLSKLFLYHMTGKQVLALGGFCLPPLMQIKDPNHMSPEGMQEVFNQIREASFNIAGFIRGMVIMRGADLKAPPPSAKDPIPAPASRSPKRVRL